MPERSRERAGQDARGHGGARGREQGDRVAVFREPSEGRAARDGRALRHASADRRADPPTRGDVTATTPPSDGGPPKEPEFIGPQAPDGPRPPGGASPSNPFPVSCAG